MEWHDITVAELKTWLGLVLAMGFVNKTVLQNYWTRQWLLETPGHRKPMTSRRFQQILQVLFVNVGVFH